MEEKVFRGLYLWRADSSFFRPCADPSAYRLLGRGEALGLLRERFRFTAVMLGSPLFAVFRGHLVRDTSRAVGAGETAALNQPKVATRFFLTRLDTLRARLVGDCGGLQWP